MTRMSGMLVTLALTLAPTVLKAQQCAPPVFVPKWVWHTLEWVDYTGNNYTFDEAAVAWQGRTGNSIVFAPSTSHLDVIASYQTLPPDNLGKTIHVDQNTGNPSCSHKTDYCGICMDHLVMYYVELQFD